MADNTFDFRISQPVYVAALEEYQKMETVLEEEMESQKKKVEGMQDSWHGFAANAMQGEFPNFLEEGKYGKARRAVKAMRTHMEGCLPEINALLARCEGFLDQLESDTYVEPPRPAEGDNTTINGGILSLDYSKIAGIKDLCDQVIEKNRELTVTMEGIIRGCSGLIEGTSEDLTALKAASRKLNRIGNYRDSFQAYEAGIRALEFDMALELSSLSDNPWSLRVNCGLSWAEVNSGVDDFAGSYHSYMSQKELESLLKTFQANGDTEEIRRVAAEIFAKDTDEWTDTDAEFITLTWDYAIQNQNVELIEAYTAKMLVKECSSGYKVMGDAGRIQRVMERLDPETQGAAYYTLNRLCNLETSSLKIEKEPGSYDVNVSIEEGLVRIAINTQVTDNGLFNPDRASISLTVYDMKDIISVDMEKKLLEFGYDTKGVEQLRMSILSDTDVKFAEKFYGQDYAGAFEVDPEGMSEETLVEIAGFMVKLEDMGNVVGQNAGTAELENILNTLLYADQRNCPAFDRYHHDEYLDCITEKLKKLSTRDVSAIMMWAEDGYSDEELEKLALEGKEYYNQYSLWEAVRSIHNIDMDFADMDLLKNAHRDGYAYMEISGLEGGIGRTKDKGGAGGYSFILNIKDTQTTINGMSDSQNTFEQEGIDPQMFKDDYFKISVYYPDPQDVKNDELSKEIKKLEKEQSMWYVDTLLDVGAGSLDCLIPGYGTAINALRAAYKADDEELIDCITSCAGDMIGDSPDGKPPIKEMSTQGVINIVKGIYRAKQLAEDIEECRLNEEVNNFGKYTCMSIDYVKRGEDKAGGNVAHQYIGYQPLAPQTAYNMYRLERDGIDAYLKDQGDLSDAERRDLKTRFLEQDYATESAWMAFVNGGEESMLLTEPEEVIKEANRIIDNYKQDAMPFGTWLNP